MHIILLIIQYLICNVYILYYQTKNLLNLVGKNLNAMYAMAQLMTYIKIIFSNHYILHCSN